MIKWMNLTSLVPTLTKLLYNNRSKAIKLNSLFYFYGLP